MTELLEMRPDAKVDVTTAVLAQLDVVNTLASTTKAEPLVIQDQPRELGQLVC